MAGDLPMLELSSKDGAPTVVVDGKVAATVEELFAALPDLSGPDGAVQAARAVNHFAQGFEYDVILNPERFAERFRTKFAAEPEGQFVEGRPRLTDFGMPDLDAVQEPRIEGGNLIFYAQDGFRGMPYIVQTKIGAEARAEDYVPMPTT